jgi:ABC-2 type transport system permease protein
MSDLALPAPRATASRPAAGLTATATMVTRCLRLGLRNVDGLITALALPVMLMLIFVYLFGGALHTGTSYVNYVVPGVLLVCLGFGTGTTAVTVSQDMNGSIIDRLRSMNTPATSLITGHVVASTLRNLISTALVFGVAFAIGFRPSAGALAWLAAIGLLALFIMALSWLAAAIGLLARSAEAAGGMTFLIAFLPYPSSAFVPVSTMPGWLQGFAAHQPASEVIDALRGLLLHGSAGSAAVPAVAWSLGIIAVSIAGASAAFRIRTR